MPNKCCVPSCTGNYKNGPKVAVFSFPKDVDLCKKWTTAIKRENFVPTKNTKVCELHFKIGEIERETSYFDERSGRLLTAPLPNPRLKKDVIPTLFPGFPSYLSKPDIPVRENPDLKRMRLENAMVEKAVAESIQSHNSYEIEKSFTNVDELYAKLNNLQLGKWVYMKRQNYLCILYLEDDPHPYVKCALKICENLQLSVFIEDVEILSLPNKRFSFPLIVNNLNQLQDIILELQHLVTTDQDLASKNIKLATEALYSLINNMPEKETIIKFLIEQIKLLDTTTKNRLRYTCETTLFCGLLFSISPHAYKFLRSSGNLILPSLSTIQRLCNSFTTNPQIEQTDAYFLQYVNSKFKALQNEDKLIVIMVDEIHLKAYMDYKGGNVVGQAFNSSERATSAYVFMISSLLSSYKDVVHILPTKTLDGETLHCFIKNTITGLEKIGFEVLGVVTDNHTINRKAMSYFENIPQLKNQYPHPVNSTRPLFYIVDTVHILKCIRNNWINQRPNQHMTYPDFNDNFTRLASFETLKAMHNHEAQNLLKYGFTLSLKALYPTSMERQNVKLALQVFNSSTVTALRELGPKLNFENYEDVATFIEIINTWWTIVNVKTLWKGKRLKNEYAEPITKASKHQIKFLTDFCKWLKKWESYDSKGKLTNETHWALFHSTDGLIKMLNYCLTTKNFNFFLCGKIQTDKLEERFGKYRQLAGAQYHISARQLFECENKLRMQTMASLHLHSKSYGDVSINMQEIFSVSDSQETTCSNKDLSLSLKRACFVNEDDIDEIEDNIWPVLGYIAGYAAYSVNKKLKCEYCKAFLIDLDNFQHSSLIAATNRGGLCYPSGDVITCAVYVYTTVLKCLENEDIFLKQLNQRHTVKELASASLSETNSDLFIGHKCQKHLASEVRVNIVHCVVNILLNNYCKKHNDVLFTKTMPHCKRK